MKRMNRLLVPVVLVLVCLALLPILVGCSTNQVAITPVLADGNYVGEVISARYGTWRDNTSMAIDIKDAGIYVFEPTGNTGNEHSLDLRPLFSSAREGMVLGLAISHGDISYWKWESEQ